MHYRNANGESVEIKETGDDWRKYLLVGMGAGLLVGVLIGGLLAISLHLFSSDDERTAQDINAMVELVWNDTPPAERDNICTGVDFFGEEFVQEMVTGMVNSDPEISEDDRPDVEKVVAGIINKCEEL